MALAWVLRHESMSSVLIGASHIGQIDQALAAVSRSDFTPTELSAIDAALAAR
jgi:L-glyceraldehyde 3-phosphate reductase